MKEILPIIGQAVVVIFMTWLYLRKEIVSLRKSANDAKKSLNDSEKTIGETYKGLLEEFRRQYSENLNAMKERYDSEILSLKKKLDEFDDELTARKRTDKAREDQLTEALKQKEYFRGKAHEAEEIIEKHLKKVI